MALMQKKIWKNCLLLTFVLIVLIVIVTFADTARAEIKIDGPGKDVVNLGDDVVVSGYILEPRQMAGFFSLDLECGSTLQLLLKYVNLRANESKEFSESLPMVNYMEGPCKIRAALKVNGEIVDEAESGSFEITRMLQGNFKIDKNVVQLGSGISIVGEIFKMDGTKLDGIATITFKQQGVPYFTDVVTVVGGKFEYNYATKDNPAGQYMIDITASDSYGNTMLFGLGGFTIISNLTIYAQPSQIHVLPGGKFKVGGEASVLEGLLEKGKAVLQFITAQDLGNFETEVESGKFSQQIYVPKNMKSGKHDIKVDVLDEFGNFGTAEVSVIVDPVETRIEIVSDAKEFSPGQTVTIKPVLLDQANDVISASIAVVTYNPDGDKVAETSVESDDELTFKLDDDAMPGTYRIRAYTSEVEQNVQFYVVRVEKLEVGIEGTTLVFRNVGNVKYEKSVEIRLDSLGKQTSFVNDLSLELNETTSLDLGKMAEAGIYDVYVLDKVFKNVEIAGEKGVPFSLIVYGVVGLVAVISVAIWIRKRILRGRRIKIAKMLREKKIRFGLK